MTSYTEENGNLTLQLPSAIEVNGSYNIITWNTGNYNIHIDTYYLNNSITIKGVTYNAGSITKEQAETILASVEYYSAHKAGRVDVTTQMEVSRQNMIILMKEINGYLYARVNIDDYIYDRVFTLKVTLN